MPMQDSFAHHLRKLAALPYRLANGTLLRPVYHKDGQQVIPFGNIHQLPAASLGENRTINVYLPIGYGTDATIRYPAIYLTDGGTNEHFFHFSGIVQFLNMTGALAPCLVVGIANTNRNRDFTFPSAIASDNERISGAGGGGAFLQFLEHEVIPYIEQQYAVNKKRTLAGQSLGGLFTAEVLWRRPMLFQNYLIASPSLWWNNHQLPADLADHYHPPASLHAQVWIATGKEGKAMEENARNLTGIINARNNKHFNASFQHFPEENHFTIFHNASYWALSHMEKHG